MMSIEEIKGKIVNELNRDPFADPTSCSMVERRIPQNFWSLLIDREGAAGFLRELPLIFPADRFADDFEAHLCWERIGNFYKNQGGYMKPSPFTCHYTTSF
jgi:hypothetical protein